MSDSFQNVSVLVLSCDKYEDAWIPCAKSISKYWNDCPYKVILLTESKSAPADTRFDETINVETSIWSSGLHEGLSRIKDDFVIIMMEDQWPIKNINQRAVDEAVRFMFQNPDVAAIYFEPSPLKGGTKEVKRINDRFNEIVFGSPYRLSCAPAVFRKSFLLMVTDVAESPWDFERLRSYDRRTERFRILEVNGVNWDRLYGYGAIARGKWVRRMGPYASQMGLAIDFDKRRMMSIWDVFVMSLKTAIFRISPKTIVRIQNLMQK